LSTDWYWYLLGLTPAITSTIIGPDKVTLTIKGPYLGPYKAKAVGSNFFGKYDAYNKTIESPTLMEARDYMKTTRNNAKRHLSPKANFITRLNQSGDGLFPTRPDGTKITLLPMYADSSHKILPDIFAAIGEDANELCAKNESQGCFAASSVFSSYAEKLSKHSLFNVDIKDSLWEVQCLLICKATLTSVLCIYPEAAKVLL